MQIGHLQDALHELRDSIKLSLKEAATEREQYEAQASAAAQADKAVFEVSIPTCCALFSSRPAGLHQHVPFESAS